MEQLRERSREGRKETISKAEYGNREGTHEKSGWRERGKPGSESGEAAPMKPLRGRSGKNGKEETEGPVAGSGEEADERKRKGSGKCGKRKRTQAPEEQLWE